MSPTVGTLAEKSADRPKSRGWYVRDRPKSRGWYVRETLPELFALGEADGRATARLALGSLALNRTRDHPIREMTAG